MSQVGSSLHHIFNGISDDADDVVMISVVKIEVFHDITVGSSAPCLKALQCVAAADFPQVFAVQPHERGGCVLLSGSLQTVRLQR